MVFPEAIPGTLRRGAAGGAEGLALPPSDTEGRGVGEVDGLGDGLGRGEVAGVDPVEGLEPLSG